MKIDTSVFFANMKANTLQSKKQWLTPVELLIVVAVAMLLIGLLMPSLTRQTRDDSRKGTITTLPVR